LLGSLNLPRLGLLLAVVVPENLADRNLHGVERRSPHRLVATGDEQNEIIALRSLEDRDLDFLAPRRRGMIMTARKKDNPLVEFGAFMRRHRPTCKREF
jgi:hypothetical protein